MRAGYEETVSTLAWVRMPPRWESGGRSTRRNCGPSMFGDAVERGQAMVQEGVVGGEEIGDGTVIANDGLKEELGFLLHVAAQFGSEFRELRGIGLEAFEVARLEPLAAEVFDQSARFGIEQHAVDLRVENFGIAEAVLRGELEELVVGQAAPQEIREARGELEIVEASAGSMRKRKRGETRMASRASCMP